MRREGGRGGEGGGEEGGYKQEREEGIIASFGEEIGFMAISLAVLTWCQLKGIPASLVVSYLPLGLTFKEQVLTFKDLASDGGYLSKTASLLVRNLALHTSTIISMYVFM